MRAAAVFAKKRRHVRFYRAWRDAVHSDSARPELCREIFDQDVNRAFLSRVGGDAREVDLGRRRRQEYDSSALWNEIDQSRC